MKLLRNKMTAYVHAEIHKIGTASIQTFLKQNKEILKSKNFYYPESMIMFERIYHRKLKWIFGREL